MSSPNLQKRRAGILLHPTSLPSGVLDGDVEHWLQLMDEAGFSVWQVLPLGEPQNGLSPYQCTSAFAFKGSSVGTEAIADSLGVETVLEGSVRKAGSRLRINVQLID